MSRNSLVVVLLAVVAVVAAFAAAAWLTAPPPAPPASQAATPAVSAPQPPAPAARATPAQAKDAAPAPAADLKGLVDGVRDLQDVLLDNPGDIASWKKLGNAYMDLHRYREAVEAYSQAALLAPHDPAIKGALERLAVIARQNGVHDTQGLPH